MAGDEVAASRADQTIIFSGRKTKMATQPHTPKQPAAPTSFTRSPGMAPAAPLMRLLASFDRPKVEAFAEVSIALLDLSFGRLWTSQS